MTAKLYLLGLLTLSVLTFVQADSVRALTAADFDSVIDGSVPAFVEFYAPWCGHCKNLAPEYELVGESFKSLSSKVLVAKVDCDEHKSLCSKQGVSGYPTLKWFPKGSTKADSYDGGRTADDIISFINQKTGLNVHQKKPPTKVVDLTESNFDSIALAPKHVFVKFYAPWCGHCKKLAPDWEKLANAFSGENDVVIAKVDAEKQKALGTKYEVTGYPTLIYFDKENKQHKYSEGRTLTELVTFMNSKSGAARLENGNLNSEAGLLEAFSDLASSFADHPNKDELITRAKELAVNFQGDEQRAATIYVKVMEQLAKDAKYADNEIARLKRMIENGSLTRVKADEFTKRINIIASFKK